MSRIIDLTEPLSDADRTYLEDRNRVSEIRRNEAFVGGAEFADTQEEVDVVPGDDVTEDDDDEDTPNPSK